MGTATRSPLVNVRPLRVALVEPGEAIRLGFESFLEKAGGGEPVLSVATGDELLRALDAGTVVDVFLVRMHARDRESDLLLQEVRRRHPAVHTVACLEEREQALAERAYRAQASRIVYMADLDPARLRTLLADLREPGELGLE